MSSNVLMVGDHRDSQNWGGRGQGIALFRLLASSFPVSGIIPGLWATSDEAGGGFVGTLLPQKYFHFLWRLRDKVKAVDHYFRFVEEPLGARDWIQDDPVRSMECLLRYKSRNSVLEHIYDLVNAADVVIVNGEGSGIFTTPYRRDFFFYLAILELAHRLQKRTFYVNAIISDCPFTGRNRQSFLAAHQTLTKCHATLVRDPESLDFVKKEMPGVTAEYVPDALFTWYPMYQRRDTHVPANGDFVVPHPEINEYLGKLNFGTPYICVGGSAWAANDQAEAARGFLQLVKGLRKLGLPVYVTQNCGGDRFLQDVSRESGCGIVPWNTSIFMAGAILANARLFVSGRFHPTILASLGGTPCIFLGSHSHKMESLKKTLESEVAEQFQGIPADGEVERITALCEQYLKDGDSRRRFIKSVSARRCDEAAQLPQRIQHYL